MPPNLVYVSASTLPSAEANAVHVAQMCDAFAGLGCAVTLRARRGEGGDVAAEYDLRHRFPIRFETAATHKLWLLGRRAVRWRAADSGTRYYGRRLLSLARLALWGYPTGVELHHPPRTPRQSAALAALVASPGFLGLVAISERLRAELLLRLPQLDSARILVAHDGVRADRIREPKQTAGEPLRAVYCGSFHAGKGVEAILSAAALVPEVDFDLIGGEPAQIEALRPRAPANVRFRGRMSHHDTQLRLAEYDIALAPYGALVRGVKTPEHESLASWMSPLKIFEYMGAGLPIVTSDLPVLREILQPGETALMPKPDDPVELAGAIRRLAADNALRLQLTRAAQLRLRNHTWENRAARILDFLDAGLAAVSSHRGA